MKHSYVVAAIKDYYRGNLGDREGGCWRSYTYDSQNWEQECQFSARLHLWVVPAESKQEAKDKIIRGHNWYYGVDPSKMSPDVSRPEYKIIYSEEFETNEEADECMNRIQWEDMRLYACLAFPRLREIVSGCA